MSTTIRSSSKEALKDPALLRKELDAGHVVELTDIGAVLTRLEDIDALADQLAEEELPEHMASFRTDATGVDNTIWVSPKGRTRRAAQIKVAIDPPDSLNATNQTASVAVHDGSVTEGHVPSSRPLGCAPRRPTNPKGTSVLPSSSILASSRP
jgi:hypothetical protein